MKVNIIAQYHPAAALHQPQLWATLLNDWENLPERVDSNFIYVDEVKKYPDLVALDTENAPDGSLGRWSVAYRNGNNDICVETHYGRDKRKTFGDSQVVMHNAKWDLKVLDSAGMQRPKNVLCSMIAAYCMGLGKQELKQDERESDAGMVGGLGLKYLARRHLGMTMQTWQDVFDKPEEQLEYNAKDSVATLLLAEKWMPDLPNHFWKIDMPLLDVLMTMEDRGIAVDPAFLEGYKDELDVAISEIDLPLNPNSPKQIQKYIYEQLGVKPFKFTKSGEPSTEAEVLETIDDPIVEQILRARTLRLERSTYVKNYLAQTTALQRIHPTLKQTSTATGRLSCARPNLQNVEKRKTDRMRKLFIAPQGKMLVRADFSQLELRVFAAVANEENMKQMFLEGRDIHQETADATGLSRYDAKTVNFLMLYGGQAWKISREFHISIDEAKECLARYFKLFPGVPRFFMTTKAQVEETKESYNWFGRKRRMDALYAEDWRVREEGLRQAYNNPIQGTAAEIVKLAMIDLHYNHSAPMVLQIHDELLFEVDEADTIEYAQWLKEYILMLTEIEGMQFPVEVGIGGTWQEAGLKENEI